MLSARPRPWISLLALSLASLIWLPCLHLLFQPRLAQFHTPQDLPPEVRALAARQLRLWEDPTARTQEIERMRATNAEWDFMGRTYLVLALANMALREPAQQPRYLAIIDTILDQTLRLEAAHGMYFFLMPYAHAAPYRASPARSAFLDSEIALMLAARLSVQPEPRILPLLSARIDLLVHSMQQAPVFCAESYPDECWLFDNAAAAAAIRLSDTLLPDSDHSAFLAAWLTRIKSTLVDPKTGLLISSFRYDGTPRDGPEGSSIFMIAHTLQVVDPSFA